MNNRKKWAIGFVNYYTKDLLFYQMKQISRSSFRNDVRMIIVDNSSSSEVIPLTAMIKKLGLEDTVIVIDNSHCRKSGSHAHAEGLNLVLQHAADEDFLLTQDPDFFWLIPDHISFLRGLMADDTVAAGSPYRRKVGGGRPDFPSAWGAVYALKELKAGDFNVDVSDEMWARYPMPEYDFSGDVGWVIRDRLSNKPVAVFDQRPAEEVTLVFGVHSFEARPVEYYYDGRPVALHLFRGSYPMVASELYANVAAGKLPSGANTDWNQAKVRFARVANIISRSKACRWIYQQYCRALWSSQTKRILIDYETYACMQRLFLPYKQQRLALAALKIEAKNDCMPHLRWFSSQIRSHLYAEQFFEVLTKHKSADEIRIGIALLDQQMYEGKRKHGEILAIANCFVFANEMPYYCLRDFLDCVERYVDSPDWEQNFDLAYTRFKTLLEALRFINDGCVRQTDLVN